MWLAVETRLQLAAWQEVFQNEEFLLVFTQHTWKESSCCYECYVHIIWDTYEPIKPTTVLLTQGPQNDPLFS